MPRIGSFGLSRRTKYKLELNHIIRVAVNKHVFGETRFTYLRVTSTCSQKNSAGWNKTRQNGRQGIKLPLETIAFYSDSSMARKINAERKVAENWARSRTGPHTVYHLCYIHHSLLFLILFNLFLNFTVIISCSKEHVLLNLNEEGSGRKIFKV